MKIVSNKALLLGADHHDWVCAHIERSKLVKDERGNTGVAVYWGLDEAEAMVRLGYKDTPSPLLRDYKWPGKFTPFDHQKDTASFLSIRRKAFCFNEQGTGKTASVIWAADYLMNMGKINRVLVICPLSIMKSAWQEDLFTFAMHRSCSVAHGGAEQRKKIIAEGAEFVIINFDGVGTVRDEIVAGGFDLIVIDEATAYKNPQTNRWKVLRKIVAETNPGIWMLTGTPAAQSPVDAYGLAKMLDTEACPKHFGMYRESVMRKVSHFKWVPKPEAQQIVHTILQPAIRFEKKDCLDLPSVTFTEREAPLSTQQLAYYNKLKQNMLFESGGEEVSAVNAAAQLNKLLQISGGAVYTDTGEVLEFNVNNRLNVVLEVIRESSNKVLVFVPFTHTIELLRDKMDKEKIPTAVIDGRVSLSKRSEAVERFQKEKDPQVLLIQPQAASHGLTLTAADTIVWYAPVTSVETYLQANARIDRPGQENPMTIVHVKGSPVEDRLYSALRGNVNNHKKLIDLYNEEMRG